MGSTRVITRLVSLDWDGNLVGLQPSLRAAIAPDRLVRWAVTNVSGPRLTVEAAVWEGALDCLGVAGREEMAPKGKARAFGRGFPGSGRAGGVGPFVVAQIVPTGVGLDIGGYAGDATPACNLLAEAADYLVTNPNAVNAADLNWASPKICYVEGALLDSWIAGEIALRPVRSNRLGMLVDRSILEAGGWTLIENAAAAFRTVGGGRVDIAISSQALLMRLETGVRGSSGGALENPSILLETAAKLIEGGAQAIALVTDFRPLLSATEADSTEYLAGRGVDPFGGLEAVLSHLVVKTLGVPCAHAPFLWPSTAPCDERAAAEELGGTYLMCVLRGLARAPQPVEAAQARQADLLGPDVVVAPQGAFGGAGVVAAALHQVPLVAVDNRSVLEVTPDKLLIEAYQAGSYLEAAGVVLALKAGICPHRLRRRYNESPA